MRVFFRRKKPEIPPYWNHYLQLNRKSISSGVPIESLNFSVIDIESTGTNIKKDRMITFAGIQIRNLKVSIKNSLELIINHEDTIRDGAIHIHELIKKDKYEGITEIEASEKILRFIGSSILVGYYVGFDISMLNQVIKKLFRKKLLNPFLDIPEQISRVEDPVHRIFPGSPKELKKQCESYGIELADQHTAAGDAFASAQLFIKVLGKLRKRGIQTWGDLSKK